MSETRKLAAILVSDVVGYSRLAGADEDRILARLRTLRSDLIDPTIAVHNGRIVKRTGDGSIVEFRSVVDAVRCAIEVQNGLVERNAGVPEDRQILFRVGIHVGDVVEESDGDLMGDGVNIAARLESVAQPGAINLSEDAYRQVKARFDLKVRDLGPMQLKNIAEPIRVYAFHTDPPAEKKSAGHKRRRHLASALVVVAAILGGAIAWYFGNQPRTPIVAATQPTASAPTAMEPETASKWENLPRPVWPTAPPQSVQPPPSPPVLIAPTDSVTGPPPHNTAAAKPVRAAVGPRSVQSPSVGAEGAPDRPSICDPRNWIAGGIPVSDPSAEHAFFVCSKP
jgi:class 3 adenylate cyclase